MAKRSRRFTRTGSVVDAPKKSLVIRSAERSRLTKLRDLPVADRKASVDALLKIAK